MTERSWYWGGTSTGDAGLPAPYGAPYSDDMFSDIFSHLFSRDRNTQGVVPTDNASYSGDLSCTYTNSAVTVGTGIAIVDGKVYASDSTTVLNFPGDGAFYIVLRKSWVSQTVRLAIIAAGSLTRTDGVTWDVPIHHFVRAGGTVTTYNDIRYYAVRPSTNVIPVMMWDLAVGVAAYAREITLSNTADSGFHLDFVLPTDYNSDLKIEIRADSVFNGLVMVYGVTLFARDFDDTPVLSENEDIYASGAVLHTQNGTLLEDDTTYSEMITLFDSTTNMPDTSLVKYRGGVFSLYFNRVGGSASDTAYYVDVFNPRITYKGV